MNRVCNRKDGPQAFSKVQESARLLSYIFKESERLAQKESSFFLPSMERTRLLLGVAGRFEADGSSSEVELSHRFGSSKHHLLHLLAKVSAIFSSFSSSHAIDPPDIAHV